jgi:predicted transcriptional regulator
VIRYEDISAAIQVRHLQVEIGEALTFERGDRAELAASAMASRRFDQAPVVDGDRVVGLVRASTLITGVATVAGALEEIRTDHLVSADAPVSRALGWLMETPCLFVLDGRQVTGLIPGNRPEQAASADVLLPPGGQSRSRARPADPFLGERG